MDMNNKGCGLRPWLHPYSHLTPSQLLPLSVIPVQLSQDHDHLSSLRDFQNIRNSSSLPGSSRANASTILKPKAIRLTDFQPVFRPRFLECPSFLGLNPSFEDFKFRLERACQPMVRAPPSLQGINSAFTRETTYPRSLYCKPQASVLKHFTGRMAAPETECIIQEMLRRKMQFSHSINYPYIDKHFADYRLEQAYDKFVKTSEMSGHVALASHSAQWKQSELKRGHYDSKLDDSANDTSSSLSEKEYRKQVKESKFRDRKRNQLLVKKLKMRLTCHKYSKSESMRESGGQIVRHRGKQQSAGNVPTSLDSDNDSLVQSRKSYVEQAKHSDRTDKSILISGQQTFSGDKKTFKCPQCRYLTDRKNNLKRHIVTMHQESGKTLECCGVSFQSKAALRDHNAIFHRDGFRCRICSRNFCRKALLRRHLTVHSGQKDFFCDLCGYATSHKSNLERHQKVHNKREVIVKSSSRGMTPKQTDVAATSDLSPAYSELIRSINKLHHLHTDIQGNSSLSKRPANSSSTTTEQEIDQNVRHQYTDEEVVRTRSPYIIPAKNETGLNLQ